jgi:hypothetical protein
MDAIATIFCSVPVDEMEYYKILFCGGVFGAGVRYLVDPFSHDTAIDQCFCMRLMEWHPGFGYQAALPEAFAVHQMLYRNAFYRTHGKGPSLPCAYDTPHGSDKHTVQISLPCVVPQAHGKERPLPCVGQERTTKRLRHVRRP